MRSLISVVALIATTFTISALPAHASAKVDPNTRVACGKDPVEAFKWSVLSGPRRAEKAKSFSASGLRKAIRDNSLPRSGWFEIAKWDQVGASVRQFANGRIAEFTTVTLVRMDGEQHWEYSSSIRDFNCDPSFMTSSGDVAEPWYPLPDRLPIDPAARSVRIAIDIQGCERADRVFVDAIKYTKTEVRIRVGVRRFINPDFACPTIVRPPTEYEVALAEPIGKRAIVDISHVAPRTRASAKQLASVRAGANPLEVLLFQKSNANFCKDSGPKVYTVKPTKDQIRRWNARDAKFCPKAAKQR